MKNFLISFLTVCGAICTMAQVPDIERAKRKFFQANVITYKTSAYYPNPDTEEISVFNMLYSVYKPQSRDFEFYSKTETTEEFYKNNSYYEVNHAEKAIYEYENKNNQDQAISSSRLRQFGPATLLKKKWTFVDETLIDGKAHSHYAHAESTTHYEGKEIKVEFHLYISAHFTVSKFERKSFVEGKMGQTVTYLFSNYLFSNKTTDFKVNLPKNYSLKYYERQHSLQPLTKNTEAPAFEAVDKNGKPVSFNRNPGKKTLLLFSSTHCGYSKIITDYISGSGFKLNPEIELINIFGSDSQANTKKYFVNKEIQFAVIPDRKDLEKQFGINGYPILYFVDEKGVIIEVLDGSSEVLPFLKNLTSK